MLKKLKMLNVLSIKKWSISFSICTLPNFGLPCLYRINLSRVFDFTDVIKQGIDEGADAVGAGFGLAAGRRKK